MKKSAIGVIAGLALVGAAIVGWNLQGESVPEGPALTVFKSPACGCCGDWVKHMNRLGFDIEIENLNNMSPIKVEHGIAGNLQSCHTAVSEDGYFFEGHIPGKVIAAFLENPPTGVRGLTAPGMPMRSPGMAQGKFQPFDILLVRNDESISVYQRITSPDYE